MITDVPIDVSTVEAPTDLRDLLDVEGLPDYAAVLAARPNETLSALVTGWPSVATAASPEPVFVEPESDEEPDEKSEEESLPGPAPEEQPV